MHFSIPFSIKLTSFSRSFRHKKRQRKKKHEKGADTTSRETVIAFTELNKKKDGARTKEDESEARKRKRENTTGRSRRDHPANQTLLWISLLPPHPPTTKKGSCSRRTTRRLTRAAYHYPFTPRAPHRLLRPSTLPPVSSSSSSSFSSSSSVPRPGLFTLPSSPVATLRASIRAGQRSLRHPRRPSPLRGGGNMAALARWIHYGPRCLITQDTFLFDGRRKGERARSLASLPGPKTRIAESGRG